MSNVVTKRGAPVKKLLFAFIITIMMLFAFVNANAAQLYYNDEYHYYDAGEIALKVNGANVENLPMHPVIIDDYTMVPAREVFEAMGSKVIWHDDTCRVEIVDNGISVFVKIGDRNTIVDGKTVPIDEPQPLPMLIGKGPDGLKTMVPVRFVAEKLGFLVEWDNKTRTVSITRKEASEIIGGITNGETVLPETNEIFGAVTGKTDSKYDYIYIAAKKGVSPKISRYTAPERVVLDFPGVKFSAQSGGVNIGGNCVDTVRYSNHDSHARLVLDVSDDAQIMILSDENGILIRAEKSPNKQIVYDGFAQRVYFDKNYAGNGKKISNGYSVTFSNIKMENQKILINDGVIYEIIISNSASGCTVSVDGSNKLTYTAEKGFYKGDVVVEEEKPVINVSGKPLVVIDAGHGGEDPGAVSYDGSGKIVARESHINLAIALMVGEKLKNNGVEVIYTRDKDKYISLQERSDLANSVECDMFVSIHCNSIENPEINGTQVYYHPSSETGTYLAENIYKNILNNTPLAPKETQNGSHLFVIRTTASPAVLVETAFISNQSDRNYLQVKANQEKIAEAIFQGIMQTINEK